MPPCEREGGKEERKERREEGREEESGASQHSTTQRSNTAAEKVNSRAWSWENIPGRALLLGSGGRPKAARKGWEEPPGRSQPLRSLVP